MNPSVLNAKVKGKILIIDDDVEMRALLGDFLKSLGFEVTLFPLAIEALKALQLDGSLASNTEAGEAVEVIISDIRMAQMDGLEFVSKLREVRPEIPVILITAFGSIDTAVEAMRRGAYHYLVKPFKLAEVGVTISKALERRALTRENAFLRQEIKKNWSFGDVIGKSAGMKVVFDLVGRVSRSTTNILIRGESGTGKEMIARAVHNSGPRSAKPFVAINCSAIPESLLESELFGHAKGSFTGAIARKKGLFEEAEGGTLFLDEIGDMSPQLQVKLLRVLQERKIRPVGENHLIDVDVRIIAATHKDLRQSIRDGSFREDLYYRLAVIPIAIPPLRERMDDVPLLAQYFLNKYAAANGVKINGFTKRAYLRMSKMRWNGNVRELENVVERAVVLCEGDQIDDTDLPDSDTPDVDTFFQSATSDLPTIAKLEERYIRLILEKTDGRKERASEILGVNRRTLYRKERSYGLATEEEVCGEGNKIENDVPTFSELST